MEGTEGEFFGSFKYLHTHLSLETKTREPLFKRVGKNPLGHNVRI